ncbi:HAD family hydrolase [Vreelandella sp. GE22]
MKLPVDKYKTLVFDCDGVVLNSNKVKTEAFYQAALPYGSSAAQALVDYHIKNGGVSRYKKFTYFIENIVHGKSGPTLDQLLYYYADRVYDGLVTCDIAEGLTTLRERTAASRWTIVSGGDQAELQKVFATRGIADMFDGGIFGSPDTKELILSRELEKGNFNKPALFLGDSKYDHKVATEAHLDFVFVEGWSEVENWKEWVQEYNIEFISSVNQLY